MCCHPDFQRFLFLSKPALPRKKHNRRLRNPQQNNQPLHFHSGRNNRDPQFVHRYFYPSLSKHKHRRNLLLFWLMSILRG